MPKLMKNKNCEYFHKNFTYNKPVYCPEIQIQST